VPLDGDFTIALRLDVPDAACELAAKFDPVTRTGFTLRLIAGGGGYNGPGDDLRISFGIDAGTDPMWEDCGRPCPESNYVSNSLTVFDGAVHAATSEPAGVHRYLGDASWEDLGLVPREGAAGVGPLIVHRGDLYAATWNYDWTRVHDQDLAPCRVYRFDRPGRWEDCGQPGASRRLFSLASFRGDLLVAGDDATLHAHRGGGDWEQVGAFDTFAHPMTVHDGNLVLGMLQPASVRSFDGRRFQDLGNPLGDPARCDEVHSLVTHDGSLYAGTWPLGRVARYDAAARRWRQTGRLGDATEVMALTVYNGTLYAGTIPRAEVFRYERDGAWTGIRRLFAPAGWQPVTVGNMRRPPDGDRRMRQWTRVTSLAEHDGYLFASTGSCTSALADAPPGIRGAVHRFRTGAVATTARPLAAGRRHIRAVRSGGRLAIFVDDREEAVANGGPSGSIGTDAPLRVGAAAEDFRVEGQDEGGMA
jgi:hypothetical protein